MSLSDGKAALEEEPQMLVDYVRVYQFDGQTVEVAERPESDGRGPRGVDAITALAIGVALGFILMSCLVSLAVEESKAGPYLSRFPSSFLPPVLFCSVLLCSIAIDLLNYVLCVHELPCNPSCE